MGVENSKVGDFTIYYNKELGKGGFGTVYKGQKKITKEDVAVKKCNLSSKGEMATVMKEITGLSHVPEHENIIKLHGYHFHDDSAYIFMEFCELGDLEKYVKATDPDSDKLIDIMLQCVKGIVHMHSLKEPIVHRDLKPQNILFTNCNGKVTAKIADFGLAKVIEDNTKLKTVAGTLLYMAPELLIGKPYDHSVDTFSLGLVFLSMILYENVGELIPLSATALKSGDLKSIAMEMVNSKLGGSPLPKVTVPNDSDHPKQRMIKKLINAMVVFEGEGRLSLSRVASELQGLLSMEPTSSGSSVKFSMSSTQGGAAAGQLLFQMMMAEALRNRETKKVTRPEPPKDLVHPLAQLIAALGLEEGLLTVSSKDLKFRLGDRVLVESSKEKAVQLQKRHGGWVAEMEMYLGKDGWVKEIESKTMVTVKFDDGYRFAFNVELLTKHDGPPIQLGITPVNIKEGEMVQVIDNPADLVSIQKKVKWEPEMVLAKGMGGVVHKILHSGVVVVECFNGDVYGFSNIFNKKKWDLHSEKICYVWGTHNCLL